MENQEEMYPYMNGTNVFKHAVVRFPQVINEALTQNGYQPTVLVVGSEIHSSGLAVAGLCRIFGDGAGDAKATAY